MFLERSEHGYSPPSTTQYPLTTTPVRAICPHISPRSAVRVLKRRPEWRNPHKKDIYLHPGPGPYISIAIHMCHLPCPTE